MNTGDVKAHMSEATSIAHRATDTLESTCTAAQRDAAVRALRAARDMFSATIDAVIDAATTPTDRK